LAVIPARGGSKRIPRKNIRLFDGKPIIAYSIDAARQSALFDRIVVSTDDDEIARIAREWGAETPFIRPPALSDDHTGTNAVVRHAVEWMEAHGTPVAEVCCVYATAPMVTGEDIRAAHTRLSAGTDFVASATRFEFPVQRALVRSSDGKVVPMFPQWIASRSQDLDEALHDAGPFYWGRPDAYRRHDILFDASVAAYELPSYRVQDIDSEDDWIRAERLFQLWREQRCASPSA
jgi:pseudaminic acid cytidylyltransferase